MRGDGRARGGIGRERKAVVQDRRKSSYVLIPLYTHVFFDTICPYCDLFKFTAGRVMFTDSKRPMRSKTLRPTSMPFARSYSNSNSI